MTKGANAGGAYGDDGANGFRERLARLDKDARDVKLVYEAEVVIDDGYESDAYLAGDKRRRRGCLYVYCDTDECSWTLDWWLNNAENPAKELRALFGVALRYIHRFSPDNSDVTKKYLTLGALYGMRVETEPETCHRCEYIGPASICFDELDKNVVVIGESAHSVMPMPHQKDFGKIEYPLQLKGRYKEDPYCYDYEYRIQWCDGLPYKVYAKIDLTPMKDKLLRRDSKQ